MDFVNVNRGDLCKLPLTELVAQITDGEHDSTVTELMQAMIRKFYDRVSPSEIIAVALPMVRHPESRTELNVMLSVLRDEGI